MGGWMVRIFDRGWMMGETKGPAWLDRFERKKKK